MSNRTSRRSFLRGSATLAAASTGVGSGLVGACSTAAAAAKAAVAISDRGPETFLDQNEYPDGPCAAALRAIAGITPRSGRYLGPLTADLLQAYARTIGIGTECLIPYAGSFWPLNLATLAFTSSSAGLVHPEPTFEVAPRRAQVAGAPVHGVPLRSDYSYDLEAINRTANDEGAGLIYLCNPNNPTGGIVPRGGIEYILDNKPEGSVLLVDEAYIEFSDNAVTAVGLVAAGRDVIALRTFSKIYGLAGLRLGFAVARPELLNRLRHFGFSPLPVTALAAALASLEEPGLVPERKKVTAARRKNLVDWLSKRGYTTSPSESNCFLVDVRRPAKTSIDALKDRGVHVGRTPAAHPNTFRLTVGNEAEIGRFKEAFSAAELERADPR